MPTITADIKIKRGNKADLPTLSAGEQGFCNDSRELFIGHSAGNKKLSYPAYYLSNFCVGDNLTDNQTALSNLLTLIGSDNATIIIDSGIYVFSDDLTIPFNITLCFLKGGILAPSAGKTLTINSYIDSGLYQIFSGDGSILGSPKNKYFPVIWFGAVADGLTDDTTPLQKAINLAEVSGKKVFLMEGTHLITTLTIDNINVNVSGLSRDLTIIKKSTSAESTQAILITANNIKLKNFSLEGSTVNDYKLNENGISIVGTSLTPLDNINISKIKITKFGSSGIKAVYTNNITVDNCRITNNGYAGIMFSSCVYGLVNNCYISDITPGTASNCYGISFTNTNGETKCSFCRAIGNTIENISVWEAIDTHGGDNIQFIDNIIKSCKYGINISPDSSPTNVPNNILVSGNIIDIGTIVTPGRAIGSGGIESGTKATNINITNNIIKGYGIANNSEGAIMFYAVNGLTITNNTINNSISSAINLYSQCDNVTIEGNNINGIVTGVSNASGMIFRNPSINGFVGNNYINATAEYGVWCNGANPNLMGGNNRIKTSGSKFYGGDGLGEGWEFYGTRTFDMASLADQTGLNYTVTCGGCKFGDSVMVSAPASILNMTVTAFVSATNTVEIMLQNESGSTVDMASGEWKVKAVRL